MTSQHELSNFRGEFPNANLNARRIASALEAPGCHRRTVLEAGVVDIDKLGRLVTSAMPDRQSPFAITRGNKFEAQVTDNGMATVLALARRHLDLEIPEAREADLSSENVRLQYPDIPASRLNEVRARLTRKHVEKMLANSECAINLLRHAMTKLNFGGEVAYLEQDVLAFTFKGRIHVVEIKSFAMIDGRADPVKASATVRQTAIYVLSLQNLAVLIGFSPKVVDTNVMIVLPENLTLKATASVFDTNMQVQRLRRQLAEVPNAAKIIAGLPYGTTLPPEPDWKNEAEVSDAKVAASNALSQLPPRFGEGCVACQLFRFCREEADRQQSVTRLGNAVASACGSITTIDAALDFITGRRHPTSPGEAAATEMLARGAAAEALVVGGE